jgi:hypothetical protein
MLPTDALVPLAIFMALLLALALHGLSVSGHFPREHRAPALASGLGRAILYGAIAVALVCLAVAIVGAWLLIPWYAAVIGGGLAILCAPLVLQRFPDRFVNGYGALLVFAGASAALAVLLVLAAKS